MCSDGCRHAKVFEKFFSKKAPHVRIIYPDEKHQTMLIRGICNVKNSHRFDERNSPENPVNIFKLVEHHLRSSGAKRVIVGCTDINVVFSSDVNSLFVLKDLILQLYKGNQKCL